MPLARLSRFGSFELDLATGELRKGGVRIKLQEQPFQVLKALLERPGEVVTREELRERLWPGDTFVEFDDGLNTAVRKIRQALGDSADNPRFVETLPRRGYRFIAPVNGGTDVSNEAEPSPPAQPRVVAVQRSSPVWLQASLIGVAVLVVVLAAWRLRDREPTPGLQVDAGEVSVAVLPLDDLSPDGDQGHFSDGMTDALISNLGSISALRVISRTSVMQYKDARRSVPEVARELGVTHVVDGSVLRAGGKVRITVQLIDAAADRQMWSESYERELAEILVLQREVARVVVDGIRVKLTGTEEALLTGTTTVSPPAYEAYLRGHEALGRFQFVEGIDFFNAAIEEEPNFALAHSFLAHSYLVLGLGFTKESPKELVLRAQAAVRKALELDNTLADAHRILGDIRLNYEWDWEGAESAYRQALVLNPSHALARLSYSFLMMIMGRRDEGFLQLREARKLDPLSMYIRGFEAMHYRMAGKYDQAIEHEKAVLLREPHLWIYRVSLAESYALKGLYNEALDHVEKARAQSGDDLRPLAHAGWIHGLAGNRSGATAVAQELEELSRRRYVPPFLVALVFTGLKDNAKARDWLESGLSQRDLLLTTLMVDPRVEPLRSEPRFKAVLEKMGFPTLY